MNNFMFRTNLDSFSEVFPQEFPVVSNNLFENYLSTRSNSAECLSDHLLSQHYSAYKLQIIFFLFLYWSLSTLLGLQTSTFCSSFRLRIWIGLCQHYSGSKLDSPNSFPPITGFCAVHILCQVPVGLRAKNLQIWVTHMKNISADCRKTKILSRSPF